MFWFRYLPGLSKTVKLDIKHCNQESLRRPVDCYCVDVILTYKTLISHWPSFTSEEIAQFPNRSQPLFLTPKSKFKIADPVWFQKSPVGKNTLGKTVKALVDGTPGISKEGRTFTNKTPRRIGITRMEESLVPVEKGMRITGHRDSKSYAKYNAHVPESEQRACQDIISGDSVVAKGMVSNYQDLLRDQEEKVHARKVCGISIF